MNRINSPQDTCVIPDAAQTHTHIGLKLLITGVCATSLVVWKEKLELVQSIAL